MKEIDNVKYYSIIEIQELFFIDESEENIRNCFEDGTINGKLIEKEWHANKEEIEQYYEQVKNQKLFFLPPYEIDLGNIKLNGRILDIGGGGEGIIGQLKGQQVVSIDLRRNELEEALKAGDTESLKIIMDARELKFLNDTFDSVTAFFSLMYTDINDHEKIFKEIYRILKDDGELSIWEINIRKKKKKEKELLVLPIKIKLCDKQIIAGYGTLWNKEQNISHYLNLAKKVGFTVSEKMEDNEIFCIIFEKTKSN